ncbi:MAG: radical SAM protein [bacterium]|nr:radical SAM protein [bacterium]
MRETRLPGAASVGARKGRARSRETTARPAPFCHTFSADGRHFVYDVHTNGLLEVEPALAAVLPLYGPFTRREIVAELAPRFDAATVRAAFAAIEQGRRERGLFLARRPRLVPPPQEQAAPGVCDRDLQHLVLTVTERCNLRCRYCVHGAHLDWVRPHGRVSMSVATAQRAVRWFLDRADPGEAPVISFYGGEALLEPELIAAVVATARAHPRGAAVRFALDTNGVLLDERAIDLAVRERMYVQVSLDGPAPEHDRHSAGTASNAPRGCAWAWPTCVGTTGPTRPLDGGNSPWYWLRRNQAILPRSLPAGAPKRVPWPLLSATLRSSAGIIAAVLRSAAPGRPAAIAGPDGASCT